MTEINALFQAKVIELRDLYIAMYSPQVRNDQAEFAQTEARYELLREEVKRLMKEHPELQNHPMAARIPG